MYMLLNGIAHSLTWHARVCDGLATAMSPYSKAMAQLDVQPMLRLM